MFGQHLAGRIDDAADGRRLGTAFADQSGMVVVRYETDFHAVWFVGHAKSRRPRQGAYFLFTEIADWKEQTRQDGTLKAVQDVRLILVRIGGAVQFDLIAAAHGASVVSRGDEIGFDLLTVGPELAEFQPAIAYDARIRRPAGQVFVGEVVDDAVEVFLEVEGVKGDVETVGNAASVSGVHGAATAFFVVGPAVVAAVIARGA